ncbi:hypothetical protein HY991_02880 [Candidatus Micrarchaeota archaeon]|nr:hypothetical protein [Candidatus Micrarchaeota archaeon]
MKIASMEEAIKHYEKVFDRNQRMMEKRRKAVPLQERHLPVIEWMAESKIPLSKLVEEVTRENQTQFNQMNKAPLEELNKRHFVWKSFETLEKILSSKKEAREFIDHLYSRKPGSTKGVEARRRVAAALKNIHGELPGSVSKHVERVVDSTWPREIGFHVTREQNIPSLLQQGIQFKNVTSNIYFIFDRRVSEKHVWENAEKAADFMVRRAYDPSAKPEFETSSISGAEFLKRLTRSIGAGRGIALSSKMGEPVMKTFKRPAIVVFDRHSALGEADTVESRGQGFLSAGGLKGDLLDEGAFVYPTKKFIHPHSILGVIRLSQKELKLSYKEQAKALQRRLISFLLARRHLETGRWT